MAKRKSSSEDTQPAVATGEKVSFFHNLTPVRAFIHMKVPRKDKKDKRQLTITFRMGLNGNLIRSAPDFIQTAYAGVKDHAESLVEIKKEIEGVSIAMLETDKSKRATETLDNVSIEGLAVKEIKSSKGDPSIVLTFQTVYPYDTSIWRFLGTHYAGDVFLQFDAQQASLLDLADRFERGNDAKSRAANDQPDLPGVDVEEGGGEDEDEGGDEGEDEAVGIEA